MRTVDASLTAADETPFDHDIEQRLLRDSSFEAEVTLDRYNARIKVQRHEGPNIEELIRSVLALARENEITKVSFLSREDEWEVFLSRGFVLEGILKGYYQGADGYIMTRFMDPERRHSKRLDEENRIMEEIWEVAPEQHTTQLPAQFSLRDGTSNEAGPLADMYGRIFASYPSPIHRKQFLIKSIEADMIYKVIWRGQTPVSAAGAHLDHRNLAAELTDCGTLPNFRGQGFISVLIGELERELAARRYRALYGLARSVSYGMNLVFKRFGYQYRGRLTNHSWIEERYEDLNIWVKTLN